MDALSPDRRMAVALSELARDLGQLAAAYLAKVEAIETEEARRRAKGLSTSEAATMLRKHRRTVVSWCQEGVITAEHLGRYWRIPVAEVERLLSESGQRGHVRAVSTAREGLRGIERRGTVS